MKTVQHFAEGLTTFAGITLLSHLGSAYITFRGGVIMMFILGGFAIAAYGLILIGKSLLDQRQSEASEQSIQVAILCAAPAFVLLLMFIFGGITGVFTAWQ